uniref:RING-type domain-containing protein n=1 Tax=Parascaris univalens TaxID=6257 RepID=A0A915BAX2_PARUN
MGMEREPLAFEYISHRNRECKFCKAGHPSLRPFDGSNRAPSIHRWLSVRCIALLPSSRSLPLFLYTCKTSVFAFATVIEDRKKKKK